MKVSGIAILVAVLALTAAVGFELTNNDSGSSAEPIAVRQVQQASDFNIKLFSGVNFHLDDQRGHVTVINFWASWCPPCRDEAPALERVWQAYRGRGVTFVGIDEWDAGNDARAFLKQAGTTYSTGPDPTGGIATNYGVTGLPETWFLAPDGHLVQRWTGALSESQAKAFIEQALQ